MKTVARRIDNDFCKIYPHIALSQLHLAEGDAAAGLQAAERALELAERVTVRGSRLALPVARSAKPTRPGEIVNRRTGSSVEVLMFSRQSSPDPSPPKACLPLADLNWLRTEIKQRGCYTAPLIYSKKSRQTARWRRPKALFFMSFSHVAG